MTKIISIDLETLSTAPNAVVLSMGVYCEAFEFEFFFNIDEQIKAGAAVDWSTISWWLTQQERVRVSQTQPTRTTCIADALLHLEFRIKHYAGYEGYIVMSNPASFDLAILRWHWMRLNVSAPWKHWTERCYRTYRAQIDKNVLQGYEVMAIEAHPGSKHSALVDAKRQHHILTLAQKDGLIVQ